MKRILVTGAGGFIGGHLVDRLKKEGRHVTGVDLRRPLYAKTQADTFLLLDLRNVMDCRKAIGGGYDEVYNLAADHGGIGHITKEERDVMTNNVLINTNMARLCAQVGVPKYFFSSSVCVYRNMNPSEKAMSESGAYPALPDCEYGWEKLFSERLALTQARHSSMQVRIARFKTVYGPYCSFEGGREKVIPALCAKVAQAEEGGEIEVWGDGSALRCFTYVDDLIDGVRLLMESDVGEPLNLGNSRRWSIDELVELIAEVAGKEITIRHDLTKPTGVQARNFSTERIEALGWHPRFALRRGLEKTYLWTEEQVKRNLER